MSAKQVKQPEVIIDPEFEKLLPPQTPEEYRILEENILYDGCREKLIVWKETGILLDGHNRYKICKEHEISYEVHHKLFSDRNEAKLWMLQNQYARRNMNGFQRVEHALHFKDHFAKEAEKNQKAGVNQNSDKGVNTLKELARVAGVSHDTVYRIERILKKATTEDIEALRRGDTSVNKVFEGLDKPKKNTSKKQQGKKKSESGKGKTLSKTFGTKLNKVRDSLGAFEQSLKGKERSTIKSAIKTLEVLIKEVENKFSPKV